MIGSNTTPEHYHFQRTQSRRHAHVPLTPSEPVESWWKAIAAGLAVLVFIVSAVVWLEIFTKGN